MIIYEIKKIGSKKFIGLLLIIYFVSSFVFYLQFKGVDNAKNTHLIEEIYREVRGKINKESSQKIESIKNRLDTILGQEYEMQEQYNKGLIAVDDYVQYRNLYHEYKNKREAIEYVYGRYLTEKTEGRYMVFDSYYNQLFKLDQILWGLLISIILVSMMLVHGETRQLTAVLFCTPIGRRGIWMAKGKTILLFSVGVAIIYNLTQYGLMCHFSSIDQLGASVQSIECLSSVKLSITIGQWVVLTFLLRIIIAAILGVVLLTIQQLINNPKMSLLIILIIVILPVVLARGFGIGGADSLIKLVNIYPLFT